MFITQTVTKKLLEKIVHQTFSNLGVLTSSSLLDSLKFLGFYYATNAGISINIEDLKTPNLKINSLEDASQEVSEISQLWSQGIVADTERFQSIIQTWNNTTESLKDRIIQYYQSYDPANNLYIMAFSGARGNMSQVRQLVGMRGLMSDQEGKIIDLPIQANFREGLTSLDYIISSYGARKGIVDTALKTADSGYLTRRLIYVAQDVIIREIDCHTKTGLRVFLKKNKNFKNLIGRILLEENPKKESMIITEEVLISLMLEKKEKIVVRSPLTCNSSASICQSCYGWDLAQNEMVSLGQAVGIIAAQSIGEPGTQLTMRTFHTGGIFTSQASQQVLAPFSGKLIFPDSLKIKPQRTLTGKIVFKLNQDLSLSFFNWKNIKQEIFLRRGSFLSLNTSKFLKKGQLIAEYTESNFLLNDKTFKPVYSPISGEIFFQKMLLRHISRKDQSILKANENSGVLWIASGKVFIIPTESHYKSPRRLKSTKAFARLKIISPYDGIICLSKSRFQIQNKDVNLTLEFPTIFEKFPDYSFKIVPLIKNYQWIDSHTEIATIEIFPTCSEKIYYVKKKEEGAFDVYFVLSESDIWKINSDQVNNYTVFPKKAFITNSKVLLNQTSIAKKSGFFLKRDGFKMIFQNAVPIYLTKGATLRVQKGDFIYKNHKLASLVNYTQQTQDIIQGLPKVEDLIEARKPKGSGVLTKKPGIFIGNPPLLIRNSNLSFTNKTLFWNFKLKEHYSEELGGEPTKVFHAPTINFNHLIFYQGKLWKGQYLPKGTEVFRDQRITTEKFRFKFKKEILLFGGKIVSKSWKSMKIILQDNVTKKLASKKISKEKWEEYSLYKLENGKWNLWEKFDSMIAIYENKNGEFIFELKKNEFFYLEIINPLTSYRPYSFLINYGSANFLDLGDMILDGEINPHELLSSLFSYHSNLDGSLKGAMRSLNKFQLIISNSIQAVYESQGVNISGPHIELIIRQLTSKVIIKDPGNTPFYYGEMIRLALVKEVSLAFSESDSLFKEPDFEPILLSSTNTSLNKGGFLAAAGFQETKRVLTKAALEGSTDWLKGLKECVITGRLIPAGSAFLNYKNYLDNIYYYKKIKTN
jgi:hypothetical protein